MDALHTFLVSAPPPLPWAVCVCRGVCRGACVRGEGEGCVCRDVCVGGACVRGEGCVCRDVCVGVHV